MDLRFHVVIKMYNKLRIMSIIQGGLASDLISPCLHHAILVSESTVALYYFIKQFMPGGKISVMVTFTGMVMILTGFVNETFAIRFVAESSTRSKTFKRKMATFYGTSKYRRRVVGALLPNWINLEFVSSVESLKNGIGMDYFLRYVERVLYHTMSLLLAMK